MLLIVWAHKNVSHHLSVPPRITIGSCARPPCVEENSLLPPTCVGEDAAADDDVPPQPRALDGFSSDAEAEAGDEAAPLAAPPPDTCAPSSPLASFATD